MKAKILFGMMFIGLFLASCATTPDPSLANLQQDKENLTRERDKLSAENASLRNEKARLEGEVKKLQGDVQRLEAELGNLKELKGAAGADFERRLNLAAIELDAMKNQNILLEAEIEKLKTELAEREASLRNFRRDNETLSAENDRLRRDLTSQSDALRRQVGTLSTELANARTRISQLEREKSELRAALDREIARLKEAEAQLRRALKDEIDRGTIEVNQFENVLMVSLKEQILFEPDRAELNPLFEKSLLEIARVFDRLPEMVIRVEGHTAIAPSRWPSSWDLGAARAISVVRFLQEKGRIDPTRLVASSFGEYRPVAPNDTESNRQRNRRVELILINRPLYEVQSLRQSGMIR